MTNQNIDARKLGVITDENWLMDLKEGDEIAVCSEYHVQIRRIHRVTRTQIKVMCTIADNWGGRVEEIVFHRDVGRERSAWAFDLLELRPADDQTRAFADADYQKWHKAQETRRLEVKRAHRQKEAAELQIFKNKKLLILVPKLIEHLADNDTADSLKMVYDNIMALTVDDMNVNLPADKQRGF